LFTVRAENEVDCVGFGVGDRKLFECGDLQIAEGVGVCEGQVVLPEV